MAKNTVLVLGVVFLVIGILGFFNDPIVGLFEVDAIHNWVHIASGILAIGFGLAGESLAKGFAKVFGIVYGLIGLIGLFISGEELLGLFEVNLADDILHILIAVVFLWAGFSGKKASMPASVAPATPATPAEQASASPDEVNQ